MRGRVITIILWLIATLFSVKPALAELRPVLYYSPPLSHLQLTSGFGIRRHPIYMVIRHHDGVDFAAPAGAPIYAVLNGRVAFTSSFNGYGKLVVIMHSNGKTSHYAHCSSFNVRVGEVVKRGDLIARVGNTGVSTGPHLHFEIREHGQPVDPTQYLAECFEQKESPLISRGLEYRSSSRDPFFLVKGDIAHSFNGATNHVQEIQGTKTG